MAEPRRALGTVAESSGKPRRAGTYSFGQACQQVLTGFTDSLRGRSGARYAQASRWRGNVARIGILAGVGVCATAVAAFTLPAPLVGEPAPAAAVVKVETRAMSGGIVAEAASGKVADSLVAQSKMYSTGALTVRKKANKKADALDTLTFGQAVQASAEVSGDYRLVEVDGVEGWVLDEQLISENEELKGGISMATCNRGSAIEGKLRSDTIKIYRSVCALFPGVNNYGGWRGSGRQFHKNGRALDIMLTPKAESKLGWQIAKYLTDHYKEFNVDHIIFEQKIWTPYNQRWRQMADRGGTTANHMDHVHVSIKA